MSPAKSSTPPPKQRPNIDWLNRLAKWRMILAGWQLGTRDKGDPECDAVRDQREMLLLLRAEVNALVVLCIKAGAFEEKDFQDQLQVECKLLSEALEKRFPGFRPSDDGMVIYDTAVAQETAKRWKP